MLLLGDEFAILADEIIVSVELVVDAPLAIQRLLCAEDGVLSVEDFLLQPVGGLHCAAAGRHVVSSRGASIANANTSG